MAVIGVYMLIKSYNNIISNNVPELTSTCVRDIVKIVNIVKFPIPINEIGIHAHSGGVFFKIHGIFNAADFVNRETRETIRILHSIMESSPTATAHITDKMVNGTITVYSSTLLGFSGLLTKLTI